MFGFGKRVKKADFSEILNGSFEVKYLDDLVKIYEKIRLFYVQNESLLSDQTKHWFNKTLNDYGCCRSGFKNPVTPENVFLGGIWGLFTKPVSYWNSIDKTNVPAWGFASVQDRTTHSVVLEQAQEIATSLRDSLQNYTN
jgi:hypothetical protein